MITVLLNFLFVTFNKLKLSSEYYKIYIFFKLYKMQRQILKHFFSNHYHPCKFSLSIGQLQTKTCSLATYINAYRHHGHHYSQLDPLKLYDKVYEQFIRPTDIGLSFSDNINAFLYSSALTSSCQSIQELQEKLKKIYMGNTGVQFQHITLLQQKQWLYEKYQEIMNRQLENPLKVQLGKKLVQAQFLDHFLHKKFVTFKRYSGEGAQSTIVALNHLFQQAANRDNEYVVFGMPHRGRINTLITLMGYSPKYLFRKISAKTDTPAELVTVIDDVTSHVSHSSKLEYGDKSVRVTMVHNPSHLEAQNPVGMGKTRSKLDYLGQQKAINVQIHGDSAICGQGVVYQSLLLGKIPNYNINGTIHIITNNQLGYTTKAIDSRGSKHPTDIFKAFDTPIIHVNSENIEDVYRSIELAMQYRQKWKKDIAIDLICYRKYGHNEVDQPQFTQPKMYHKIRKQHEPSPIKYSKQLVSKKLVDQNFYQNIRKQMNDYYESQFQQMQKIQNITLEEITNQQQNGAPKSFTKQWKGFFPSQYGIQQDTSLKMDVLKQFAQASTFTPTEFNIHPRIKRLHIEKRVKNIAENVLDWATCESIAFFSIVNDGNNLRLTGQDVERGTFSQRHLNLVDQKTEEQFNPIEFFALQNQHRGKVQVRNSPLSENAALSFQYGYSLDHPLNMTIWQAQFGDFYNTAQVAIDVFLTNSQNKWLRQTGITLILPHGYDGAGPEHSSCRIQRFLQAANSDGGIQSRKYMDYDRNRKPMNLKDQIFYENIQEANFSFAYPTRPSNYFHLLRRQIKRNFRKPLVIAGPKALLRHPKCLSTFQQMSEGTSFSPILQYYNCKQINQCDTIFITSGKYVYDILEQLESSKSEKTCMLTIQELFPFPEKMLQEKLKGIKKDCQVCWVQEENLNSGAFTFVQNRINRILQNIGAQNKLKYVGRRSIATTAVGSVQLHKKQSQQLSSWIKQLIH